MAKKQTRDGRPGQTSKGRASHSPQKHDRQQRGRSTPAARKPPACPPTYYPGTQPEYGAAGGGLENPKNNWERPQPEGEPGQYYCDTVDMFGRAGMALADRAECEAVYSEDLVEGFPPLLDAFRCQVHTFCSMALDQIDGQPEKVKRAADQQLADIGAFNMLVAAESTARAGQRRGQTPPEERILGATGALRIPGLDIIKEIIGEVSEGIPIPGFLKGLENLGSTIEELLRIIDKFIEGKPEGGGGVKTQPRRKKKS